MLTALLLAAQEPTGTPWDLTYPDAAVIVAAILAVAWIVAPALSAFIARVLD